MDGNRPTGLMLSNRSYEVVKWVVAILLPASGALYFGLGDLWNLPRVTEVVGTISLVSTFLGIILGVSTRTYNSLEDSSNDLRPADVYDGVITFETNENGAVVASMQLLNLENPEDMADQSEALFRIDRAE